MTHSSSCSFCILICLSVKRGPLPDDKLDEIKGPVSFSGRVDKDKVTSSEIRIFSSRRLFFDEETIISSDKPSIVKSIKMVSSELLRFLDCRIDGIGSQRLISSMTLFVLEDISNLLGQSRFVTS